MPFLDRYRGKTVLVTGHTGFKGSWASVWLTRLGAHVVGYSLEPPSQPSNFEACDLASRIEHVHGDVRDAKHLEEVIARTRPDFVFHMAAQSLVGRSFEDPTETFSTNIMGTVNVCEIVQRHAGVEALVCVTSDKCYDNREWVWGYRETDALGGHDPYSASKACAELTIAVFQDARYRARVGAAATPIASVRAGNVIGGGDWASDRLVPDVVRAITAAEDIHIRSPRATRPWQHVLEAVSGYLWLAVKLADEGGRYESAFNFGPALGPNGIAVGQVVDWMLEKWGDAATKMIASEDRSGAESTLLRLDVSRAEAELGWTTVWTVERAVDHIVDWYRAFYDERDGDMFDLSVAQIDRYVEDARSSKLAWAET